MFSLLRPSSRRASTHPKRSDAAGNNAPPIPQLPIKQSDSLESRLSATDSTTPSHAPTLPPIPSLSLDVFNLSFDSDSSWAPTPDPKLVRSVPDTSTKPAPLPATSTKPRIGTAPAKPRPDQDSAKSRLERDSSRSRPTAQESSAQSRSDDQQASTKPQSPKPTAIKKPSLELSQISTVHAETASQLQQDSPKPPEVFQQKRVSDSQTSTHNRFSQITSDSPTIPNFTPRPLSTQIRAVTAPILGSDLRNSGNEWVPPSWQVSQPGQDRLDFRDNRKSRDSKDNRKSRDYKRKSALSPIALLATSPEKPAVSRAPSVPISIAVTAAAAASPTSPAKPPASPAKSPISDGQSEDLDSSPRSAKPRLGRLNPMTLLSRRKSAQSLLSSPQRPESSSRSVSALTSPSMPDDYDPRIRGNRVHDFSAPRNTTRDSMTLPATSDSSTMPSSPNSTTIPTTPGSTTRPFTPGSSNLPFTPNSSLTPAASPHRVQPEESKGHRQQSKERIPSESKGHDRTSDESSRAKPTSELNMPPESRVNSPQSTDENMGRADAADLRPDAPSSSVHAESFEASSLSRRLAPAVEHRRERLPLPYRVPTGMPEDARASSNASPLSYSQSQDGSEIGLARKSSGELTEIAVSGASKSAAVSRTPLTLPPTGLPQTRRPMLLEVPGHSPSRSDAASSDSLMAMYLNISEGHSRSQSILDEASSGMQGSAEGSSIGQPGADENQTMDQLEADESQAAVLSAVPKQLTIAGNRFSFDFGGLGSAAQERLLEEKHRQRFPAQRSRETTLSAGSVAEQHEDEESSMIENDEDLIYNDMRADDNDFEEPVPGMNDDDDDDDRQRSQDVANFSLSSNAPRPSMPDAEISIDSLKRRGDAESQVPSAQSSHDPSEAAPTSAGPSRLQMVLSDDMYFDDGAIADADLQAGSDFDEGLLDDEESKVYGIPLRDQHPGSHEPSESSQQSSRTASQNSSHLPGRIPSATTDTSRASMQQSDKAGLNFRRHLPSLPQGKPHNSLANGILTQENLAAYHEALVQAANRAAMQGRFERQPAGDDVTSSVKSGQTPSISLPVNQESTVGLAVSHDAEQDDDASEDETDSEAEEGIIAAANADALENDDEGFYGQEFGFYAKATGGSTRSSGDKSIAAAEYAMGGYFGPAGLSADMERSYSGRVNGQDPSLTPITERSEMSQRSSMIAPGSFGPAGSSHRISGVSGPMPGLVELADALQYEDEHPTLHSLMKLRRSTFGGSNSTVGAGAAAGVGAGSTGGSGGSAASPTNHQDPSEGASGRSWRGPSPIHRASMASNASAASELSANGSETASNASSSKKTPAANVRSMSNGSGIHPAAETAFSLRCQSASSGLIAAPKRDSASGDAIILPSHGNLGNAGSSSNATPGYGTLVKGAPGPGSSIVGESDTSAFDFGLSGPSTVETGHSRESSGTDSVSYVKESEDEGGRWVKEKRRLGNDGVTEVLDREVLETGRI